MLFAKAYFIAYGSERIKRRTLHPGSVHPKQLFTKKKTTYSKYSDRRSKQTLQAQIRCQRLWRLIRVSTVCHYARCAKDISITNTCLYNFDPLKPHFYIVKLRFTGVYITFFYFCSKQGLWVPVRTASSKRF